MKLSIACICLLGLALSATATQVRYDNYKVYRFTPYTEEQRKILLTLEDQNPGVLFWKGVRHVGQPVDIMFPPHLQNEMLDALQQKGMESIEFIENVQTLIDAEQEAIKLAAPSPKLTWTAYHSTADIHQFLDEQVAAHPDVASIATAGNSYEGRNLKIIKIQRPGATPKPAIWIDANIHAREWITNAVATWVINELLNSNVAAIRQLSEDFDWYIMPVMNPDGYEYTRTTDRLWRKTRAPTSSPLGCRGADPNRNWAFHWMEGGASSNPCTETYGGASAFSEVETLRSSQYLTTIKDDVVLFLSLHSYSQLILLPYGHNNQRYPDYAEYMRIGQATAAAIATRFGTSFRWGNIVDLLYVASGGSMDWFKGTFNTRLLTFTFELRDTGRYGFQLPPAQIIPSGQEFMDGLLVLANEARAVSRSPSILPIVSPGNKLPVIETPSGPSILPILNPGNKLPIIETPSGPSILPILNPGNKLPEVRPIIETIGAPKLEVIGSASILPILTPGNKLPVIESPSGPSITPIGNPANKLPEIRPLIASIGGPTLEAIQAPVPVLPILRPGNKLPHLGKPIIF